MLVNMKKMLEDAKAGKYAIPHFNINNLEWTRFILEEAQNQNSPVILGVSEGAMKYMGGFKTIKDMVVDLIDYLNVTVPVALHLDHGSSFESCKNAIDCGFTSVMIDASKYNLEKNIEITKQVVDYAKDKNVTVEAEIGRVGGQEDSSSNGIVYADVNESVRFSKDTGIDFLAPALGSVHGLYKGKPNLDFSRMLEISTLTNLPLVLHGGTGIYDEQIKKAISCGITKINFNTELQIAWSNALRESIKTTDAYDPRKIIKFGEVALKKCVKNKCELLGSVNKA